LWRWEEEEEAVEEGERMRKGCGVCGSLSNTLGGG